MYIYICVCVCIYIYIYICVYIYIYIYIEREREIERERCNNILLNFSSISYCLFCSNIFFCHNVSGNKEKEIICLGNVKCKRNLIFFFCLSNKFST